MTLSASPRHDQTNGRLWHFMSSPTKVYAQDPQSGISRSLLFIQQHKYPDSRFGQIVHRRNQKHLFSSPVRVRNNPIPKQTSGIPSRTFPSSSRWICFEIPEHLYSYICIKVIIYAYIIVTLPYIIMHHNLHRTNHIPSRFYLPCR